MNAIRFSTDSTSLRLSSAIEPDFAIRFAASAIWSRSDWPSGMIGNSSPSGTAVSSAGEAPAGGVKAMRAMPVRRLRCTIASVAGVTGVSDETRILTRTRFIVRRSTA